MKIVVDIERMEVNNFKFEIHHRDEIIYFNFSVFNKNNFFVGNRVFEHINKFWSQQTMAFQDAVFAIYKEIDESFDDILNKATLAERIKDSVQRLYAMHPFATMRTWVVNSGLRPPDRFEHTFTRDADRNTTEDKTYIRSEYTDLITLCLMFRIIAPIWSKYTKHIRQQAGNQMKEVQSFKLLERTEIPNLAPIEKLLNYVRANIKKEANSNPVTMISEDEYPFWTMTVVCVRKLCTGDLDPQDDRANLVTLVHNFISAQSSYSDGDFTTAVHTKTTDDFSGDENKISTMESFRINMDISVIEAEELPFSVANLENVVNKVCMDLPPDLLQHCLETSDILKEHLVLRPQKALMSMVMKDAITPSGLDYLDHHMQVRCLGVTQAVLWHRGYRYLALLSTAVSPKSQEHRATVSPTKERVPQDLAMELRKVYPHVQIIQQRKAEPKEECRVTKDIEAIVDDLFSFVWQPTASISMLQDVFGPEANNRRLPVMSDIRIQLTKLAIDVGLNRLASPPML